MPKRTTENYGDLLPAFWPDSELHRRLRRIARAINRPHTPDEHRELTEIARDLKEELHTRTFF